MGNKFPGTVEVATADGSKVTVTLDGDNARVSVGGGDNPNTPPVPTHSGRLTVNNSNGSPMVDISSGLGGIIYLMDIHGKQMFAIDAIDGALLRVGGDKRNGLIYLVSGDSPQGAPTVTLSADGEIALFAA